jgi:hypothetical protein
MTSRNDFEIHEKLMWINDGTMYAPTQLHGIACVLKNPNKYIWQKEHLAFIFIKSSCTMFRPNQWIELAESSKQIARHRVKSDNLLDAIDVIVYLLGFMYFGFFTTSRHTEKLAFTQPGQL